MSSSPDKRPTLRGSLSALWSRSSCVPTVAAPVVDEVSSELLSKLSSNAATEKIANLTDSAVLELARELLANVQNRSDDWSAVGDWTHEEARLLGLLSDGGGHKPDDDDTDPATTDTMSPEAYGLASKARFVTGSAVTSFLSTYIDSLERKLGVGTNKGGGQDLDKVRTAKVNENGQAKECSVYGPASMGTSAPGTTMEVWTLPKVAVPVPGGEGASSGGQSETANKDEDEEGRSNDGKGVTLILGAGNQPMLSAIDALQRCLVNRDAVLIKHHPLRPFLLEPYAIMFEPLIRRGYLAQILDGGVPATTALLSDARVKHVHITGSLATDRAVRATLAKTRPGLSDDACKDMVTSELGCATPWIVTPGVYTPTELTHAARMVVAGKKSNGGCNCLAAQAVVIPKGWDQKDELRAALVSELRRQPTQPCYYPGSKERRDEMKARYESLGGEGEGEGEGDKAKSKADIRAYIVEAPSHGANPDARDDVVVIECRTPGEAGFDGTALTTEAFGSFLAIVELAGGGGDKAGEAGGDGEEYLDDVAVPFVNDKANIYGSLSCSLLVPGTADPTVVERAVANLRYGSVAVNSWTGIGYFAAVKGGTWGAHVQDESRQSGNGVIGNLYGLPDVAKTVVRGPPLTTTPMFDLAKEPPPIVFDAIHAVTCAPSTVVGLTQLFKLLLVRGIATMLSPLLRLFSSRLGPARGGV